MKEFKNIPSKLYEKTNDWITKEKNLTKTKYPYHETKPKPRRIMSASASHSHRVLPPGHTLIPNPNYNNFKNSKNDGVSMFENYYHDKMVEKKLIPSLEEEKAQQKKDDLDYQFEAHLRELRACNNIESQINEQYESIKKAQLKANTPSVNDKGVILQKNNKNYVEENKQKIIKGQVQKKISVNNNVNKLEQNPFHKEYGKTPKYLQNMKIEAEKQKEIDKLKKEQEKYRSLAKMFFKDAAVALIVYDITSKKSFEEIKNYWMNLVKENGPKQIIMYIVGNKCDLSEKEAVNEDEVRDYAINQNVSFYLTSAKNAIGIDDLFDEIGKKYLSPEFNNSEEIIQRKMRKNEVTKVNKEASLLTLVTSFFLIFLCIISSLLLNSGDRYFFPISSNKSSIPIAFLADVK